MPEGEIKRDKLFNLFSRDSEEKEKKTTEKYIYKGGKNVKELESLPAGLFYFLLTLAYCCNVVVVVVVVVVK